MINASMSINYDFEFLEMQILNESQIISFEFFNPSVNSLFESDWTRKLIWIHFPFKIRRYIMQLKKLWPNATRKGEQFYHKFIQVLSSLNDSFKYSF